MESPKGNDPAAGAVPWQVRRLTWFVIFGSLASSVILYRVVIALSGPRPMTPAPSTLRTVFYVVAVLGLLASIAWTRSRLEPPGDSPGDLPSGTPRPSMERFMTASVIAMTLAETSAVLGFALVFMGLGTAAEYLSFGAGTFLVLALVILPRGLRYWGDWQSFEESRAGREA